MMGERSDGAGTVAVMASAPSCVHHWLLSEPASGIVTGRCRRCGESRAFPASPEGAQRFDDYRELTATASYYAGRQPRKAKRRES